jgi:V-type H+-transporting ATPase subunit H
VRLLVSLLEKLVRNDTIQSLLVLIYDVLTENASVADYFADYSTELNSLAPYDSFLKFLKRDDEFIQLKSVEILSLLLRYFIID